MRIFFYLALLSLAFTANAVINGKLATKEFMLKTGAVAFIYSDEQGEAAYCTGTRIAKNLILTAAHCVWDESDFPIGVRQALDPLDRSVQLERIVGVKFLLKDFYFWSLTDPSQLDDIAIVQLENLSSAPVIRPGELSTVGPYTQIGYGMTSMDSEARSNPLAYLTNATFESSKEKILRVRNDQSSMAPSDSGSGILVKRSKGYEIVGALIGGGEYRRVDAYLPWIIKVMNGEDSSVWLTPRNMFEEKSKECASMSFHGYSHWRLDQDGYCLPQEESSCKDLRTYTPGLFVTWDGKSKVCYVKNL